MNTENREHRSSTLLSSPTVPTLPPSPTSLPPSPPPPLRFSKLRCVLHGIASIYISLTRWFDFPRKKVERETARAWKSRTNDYPAVDLTFDRKLRPHCVPDCASICDAFGHSKGNNLLRGASLRALIRRLNL